MALTAKDRALGWLARREYGFEELVSRLVRDADLDRTEAQALVQRLADNNLQSDERFVESFVRSQLNKCRGPIRIRADLRQRGISEGLWRDALEGINWHELAEQRRSRKFGEVLPTEPSERARQMRHLAAQGFPESVVRDLF
ncbi:MAG: regulatory protein RecX [Litorivicinus sp.]